MRRIISEKVVTVTTYECEYCHNIHMLEDLARTCESLCKRKNCLHTSGFKYEFDGDFIVKYCGICGEEIDSMDLNKINIDILSNMLGEFFENNKRG
jgi:hypothetical protein